MKLTFLSLENIFIRFSQTFKRFPFALLSSLFLTAILIYIIGADKKPDNTLFKIAFVLGLGFFLFSALRLFSNRLLCLLGVLGLSAYYFYLPNLVDIESIIVIQRHMIFEFIFFIMIFWAYFWNKAPSNKVFWRYANVVMFAFISSIVYTVILQIGSSGALFAVDKLFSLDIDGKRYGEMFVFLSGVFGTTYFLSQIPRVSDEKDVINYKSNTILTKYILTPLVFIYFLILYTYTAKILITWSFPKGILAWIIVIFSFVSVLTYLFWTPFWSEKTKRYKRYFPLVLLFQTLMLFLAIWMRVSEYGWTENRYMIALFGVWLFFISLYYLLNKDAKHKWLFISLTAVMTVSQVGPFSAYEVGKKAQYQKLKVLLEKNKPLSDSSDMKVRYEISDKIDYLSRRYGRDSLKELMPKVVEKSYDKNISKYSFSTFATKELGFSHISRWEYRSKDKNKFINIFVPQRNTKLDVRGYDYLEGVKFFDRLDRVKESDTLRLRDTKLLIFKDGKKIDEIDLTKFVKTIKDDRSLSNIVINKSDLKKLRFDYEDDKIKLKFMLNSIMIDDKGMVKDISARVLYRLK